VSWIGVGTGAPARHTWVGIGDLVQVGAVTPVAAFE